MDLASLAIIASAVLLYPSPQSIPVYIISLRHRRDRLNACLARHPTMRPQLIDAVNGSSLGNPPDKLTRGEVGCFMSHIKALQAIASSTAPYALVLEDDATVSFPECLEWVKKLPAHWHMVSLGCNWLPEKIDTVSPGLIRLNGHPLYGTHAILYTQAAAKRLVAHAKSTGISEPYDTWLSKHVPPEHLYVTVPVQASVVNFEDTDTQRLR